MPRLSLLFPPKLSRNAPNAISTSLRSGFLSVGLPSKSHALEQRSNYAEPSALSLMGGEEATGAGIAKGRARDTISDRKPGPGVSGKRKSTLNVRGALLYKKNLQQLIDESVH